MDQPYAGIPGMTRRLAEYALGFLGHHKVTIPWYRTKPGFTIGDVRVDDTGAVFYTVAYGEEERAASSFADRQIIGALKQVWRGVTSCVDERDRADCDDYAAFVHPKPVRGHPEALLKLDVLRLLCADNDMTLYLVRALRSGDTGALRAYLLAPRRQNDRRWVKRVLGLPDDVDLLTAELALRARYPEGRPVPTAA